jgi:hypothetical protein
MASAARFFGKKDGKNVEHGFNPESGARVEK